MKESFGRRQLLSGLALYGLAGCIATNEEATDPTESESTTGSPELTPPETNTATPPPASTTSNRQTENPDPAITTVTHYPDGGSNAPQATFEFDYEAGHQLDDSGSPWATSEADGVLTITMQNGAVGSAEIRLRGQSITLAGNGMWSQQVKDDGSDDLITAGDSISIESNSDFEVRVDWEPDEGSSIVTLDMGSGPDAQ